MSKERFVGFYLSAMMKAATGGRVSKLTYQYADGKKLAAKESVTVEFGDRSCVPVPVPVTNCDLLGIVLEVVKAVQEQ